MEKINKKSKKGQVTIFVIIAIFIVISIAVIFLRRPLAEQISAAENPKVFVQRCVISALEEAEDKVIDSGGFSEPSHFIDMKGTKVAYHCYTPDYDVLCVNEHPLLNKNIEKEILDYIQPKAEKCFSDLKAQLSRYNYREESAQINIEINPDSLTAKISKKITYTKNGQDTNIENFDTKINSALWDFVSITGDIMNQELECDCVIGGCDADMPALSLANPDFDIRKPVKDETGEIYSVRNLDSGKIFNFALRNCVRAPV